MQCITLSRVRALTAAVLLVLSGCGGSDGDPPSCPAGQTECSGTCQDLQTDEMNCGGCGNVCASGQTCEQGQCSAPPPPCPTGQTLCNGTCVDTQSNASHCGACGTVCPSGTCTAGQCVPVNTCMDGVINGTETCDDGNTTPEDGCSASCMTETGWACQGQPSSCHRTEIEPNGSTGTATPVPSLPSLFIRGGITPGTDVDVYRLAVTGTAYLRLDTFDGTYNGRGPESCMDVDTKLDLLNADGSVRVSDDDAGIENCSSIHPELTREVERLPAGTYFIRVSSFATRSIPAYTLRIQFQALCGDGTRQTPEHCDDGNTSGGDECPATCRPDKIPEVEDNGTAAAAQVLPLLPELIGGAISLGSDRDMFRFTLATTADLAIETYDDAYTGENAETCQGIDTALDLLAANGTSLLASDDDGGINNCSSLTPATYQAMERLAPGTYYTRVTSFGGATVPAYSLSIRYLALCGDGHVTGSEECDGGPGCTTTCERVLFCGDGRFEYPEVCEDGNTADGDGCSSTCQIPGMRSEVEPNNTRADADARANNSSPVLITGSTGFSGTFHTDQDVDVYKLQLQAARTIKLETFHGGLGRCNPGLDTEVSVIDAAGTEVGVNDDGGPGLCSLLEESLLAGTYYVMVDRLEPDGPRTYALQVTFE